MVLIHYTMWVVSAWCLPSLPFLFCNAGFPDLTSAAEYSLRMAKKQATHLL